MEKIEKDGLVAVLVSPGYGAGWSSWNGEHRDVLLFDAEIVQAVIDGNRIKAMSIAASKAPGARLGGGQDLTVEWVPKGRAFEIEEYDGSESLHVIGDRDYPVA